VRETGLAGDPANEIAVNHTELLFVDVPWRSYFGIYVLHRHSLLITNPRIDLRDGMQRKIGL
jgi:hypothetical protein